MRRLRFFALSILLVAVPVLVHAHGDKYLEFNPDSSSSLKVSDVAAPSQIFLAQNDFLGGFDFFIANPDSSGTATFSFINEQGIVIATRTVTIPTIALTSDGTRFHIDFNSQLPVLADSKYSIKVTSSMSDLRLYYSDRVQIVSHNAPAVSPYTMGVGMLGSEEQIFSFKYALYEGIEASAPIISNLAWSVITPTEMRIGFNTNEAVDFKLEYGVGSYSQVIDFSGGYKFCVEGVLTCNIEISVSPDTTYQYRLTAKDSWGNQSQIVGTFTSGQTQTPTPTPPPTDNPPVISNLRIVDVANDSVSVAWTTNEISNSRLLMVYGGFISVTAVSDPTFELEHYLEIGGGLSGSTPYLAEVTSIDLGNNQAEASISFTTLGGQPSPSPTPSPTVSGSPTPSPTSSPAPSASSGPLPSASATSSPPASPEPSISPSPSSSGDGSDMQITWSPPSGGEPSDGYRVDVFDKDGNLVKTVYAPAGSHEAEVTDLAEGEYTTIIYQNDEGVFKKVARPKTFKAGDDTFMRRLLALWPYLLLAFGSLVGFLIWRKVKGNSSQTLRSSVS